MSTIFYTTYPKGYWTEFNTADEAVESAKKNVGKREYYVMQAIAHVKPTTPPCEVISCTWDPAVNVPKVQAKSLKSLEDFDDEDF